MPETEQFRAIATAMLDRRIRNMRRLDEKTWIDTSLITHAEYQLFLDDMYAQGKYYQPDHWKEKRFPHGEAHTPIVGIRASDAEAFCEWLTLSNLDSSQPWIYIYRLPNQYDETGLEDVSPGFWQLNTDGARIYCGRTKRFGDFNLSFDHELDIDYILYLVIDLFFDFNLILAHRRTRELNAALKLTLNRQHFCDLDDIRKQILDPKLVEEYLLDIEFAIKYETKQEEIYYLESIRDSIQDYIQTIDSHLSILSLRRQGLLPAFEGILIVREETD